MSEISTVGAGVRAGSILTGFGRGGGGLVKTEKPASLGSSQVGGYGPLIYEWRTLITSLNTWKGMRLLQMGLWGIGGWRHLLIQMER